MSALELDASALTALTEKYREMAGLRASHARGMPPAPREALQRLAARFPGALAELDSLPTSQLLARLTALEAASRGGPVERWMVYVFAYHATLREALAGRRDRRLAGVPRDAGSTSSPSAKLLPAVIAAVAERTGGDAGEIEAIVRPRRRTR